MGDFPINDVTVTGVTINIPQSQYAFTQLGTYYGMSGAATMTASGTGSVACWLDSTTTVTNGLTCHYTGITSPACGGSGCALSAASVTPPVTGLRVFAASFSSGTPTITFTLPDQPIPLDQQQGITVYQRWRPYSLVALSGSDHVIRNNYMMVQGQGIYNDANNEPTIVNEGWSFTKNYLDFPKTHIMSQPTWNGYTYTYRNNFEVKQATRLELVGNIFNNGSSDAASNNGSPIDIAGAYPGTGDSDWTIAYNTLRNIPTGINCLGGGAAGPGDAPTNYRIYIHGNLLLNIDRDQFNRYGGQAFWSGDLQVAPGCTDFVYTHNTAMGIKGIGPGMLSLPGSSSGISVLMEGFKYSDNIAVFSKTFSGIGAPWYCHAGELYANNPVNPSVTCDVDPDGHAQDTIEQSSFRWINSGSTPNYYMTGNYVIGEYKCTVNCGLEGPLPRTYVELDASEISGYMTGFPAGNVTVAGTSVAARQAAIGWDDTTHSASLCGGCGADVTLLPPAQGIVTNISVSSGPTAISATYTAPDSKACYLEVSDDSFVTLTRESDGGGAVSRTVTVTGLDSLTEYDWRLQCYFQQTTGMEFSGTQLTSGSITTTSSSGTGSRFSGKVSFSGKTR